MVPNLDDKPWNDVQHVAGVNIGEVDKSGRGAGQVG